MAKIVVTAGLPYANGNIHLGSLLEYILVDVYVRFLKLIGEDAIYICGSDMHGTPIEVNASKNNMKPLEFANQKHQENLSSLKKYNIHFDNFYHTHSKENKEITYMIFERLKKNNHLYKKTIKVVFCPNCDRTLPDRYVKGTCPSCGGEDQYGDVCELCGITLKGTDLLNPYCSICEKTPTVKDSENYFFKLSNFKDELKEWFESNTLLQQEVKNSVMQWIKEGLEDWCITRDGPYFGFPVPEEENKFFYVWFDAPIGYMASCKNYCDQNDIDWKEYWTGPGEFTHIIGKDIIYFHYLFWPAVLLGSGFRLPKNMQVHGFLTVNGKKMSKSRGTMLTAEEFAPLYNPEYLRYYYSSHFSSKLADIDLDFDDFKESINNKLIANIANFCFRVIHFSKKNYEGKVEASESEEKEKIQKLCDSIKDKYTQLNFRETIKLISEIASIGNVFFQNNEPWKDINNKKEVVDSCIQMIKVLSIVLKPIMPLYAEKLQKTFSDDDLSWKDLSIPFEGELKDQDITLEKIEKLPDSVKEFPFDLRVAKIENAEDHPEADSLYIIDLDLGKEKRKTVSGLKRYYQKEALIGKKVVVLCNLKPAKLRGIMSECMVLVADDGSNIELLETPESKPGDPVSPRGYNNNTSQITFDEFMKVTVKAIDQEVVWEASPLVTPNEKLKVHIVDSPARVR